MAGGHVYFVAAEASGDVLASEVVQAIRRVSPETQISGMGGDALAGMGVSENIDLSPLSILGLFEGLLAYPKVIKLADQATKLIINANPDVVILVDSWGFTLRVAQRLRTHAPDISIVKLVGPQVWATRPGRAKTLARNVDHLLCIHEMEEPYYEPYGLKTTVIGNPALSRKMNSDGRSLRRRLKIADDQKLILVLPGSRQSEIKRVAPDLVAAAKQLHAADPSRRILFAPSASVGGAFKDAFPDVGAWGDILDDPTARYDAMDAADLALACSGTVTSELAMLHTPMIVAYRTGALTWAVARGLLYRKTHATLLNIISDDTQIVPEFLQGRLTPAAVAGCAEHLLTNERARQTLIADQDRALERMRAVDEPAAIIAARAILETLRDHRSSIA